MISVRTAVEADAPWIRDIVEASYGRDYAYPEFYDVDQLRKMILSDSELVLVAVDSDAGHPVGTASVVLEIGAYTDLVGEFGRLAVHPDWRHRGIGGRLLDERVDRVKDRLHIGLIEGRVGHPFTQRLAHHHGFSTVGYLPLKILFGAVRESMSVHVRYFGAALELRRNHPRITPDVFPLAAAAEENVSIPLDVIVDDDSLPYPSDGDFDLEELTTEGYADLLRIERGRVKNREIFGPLRLDYGAFQLKAAHSRYLLARQTQRVMGAVGFTLDDHERTARVFELITLREEAIPFLLREFTHRARDEFGACYAEIDVSAFAPRMQRTLLALGYAPAAYIPAMAFHEVERLDVVKMARLFVPLEEDVVLASPTRELAELVLQAFTKREVEPRVSDALDHLHLFDGLSEEHRRSIASAFAYRTFEAETAVFEVGEPAMEMYVILSGDIRVHVPGAVAHVGIVGAGECLGETALLTEAPHSATAVPVGRVEAAAISSADLNALVRRWPAIGVVLFRNLARGLGEKLRRMDLGPS